MSRFLILAILLSACGDDGVVQAELGEDGRVHGVSRSC
jgi:hypothetical protein